MKIVRVGFDVPLDRLFDYRCDDARESDIGARVLAPFGSEGHWLAESDGGETVFGPALDGALKALPPAAAKKR